ncbi:acetylxylan esterase [Enterococcus durans]|uniref:acetylxylan esterase n=1 Tax=Enterococcus durans TaxID=53345 RepID=UPI0039A70FEF
MANLFAFWEKTQKELSEIPLAVEQKTIRSSKTYRVDQIKFQSLFAETVTGYLFLPIGQGPFPLVLDCLGYMNHVEPFTMDTSFSQWTEIGCACFVIDNRGQGGKTPDNAPYQTVWHEAPLGRGFLAKEDWYQRRLISDHLRALALTQVLSDIATDQLFLRGGSQGGGVVLMVNSLSNIPILATFADVPSHSNLDHRIETGTGSYQVIHNYLQKYPEYKKTVESVMPYFDTKNFVQRIHNQVFISVGSHDPICPMHDFLPTYRRIDAVKQLYVYWNKGHDGGGERQLAREKARVQKILQGVRHENSNL